jgi:hypothetical protein
MNKAIRIVLIVVAALCLPALIYPELGRDSLVSPAVVLFVCGLGAIVWPSSSRDRTTGRR